MEWKGEWLVRHRRIRAELALVLATTVTVGCYEYVPARDVGLLAGRRVQLELTDSGSVALARLLGPSVEAVEGTLLADSARSYVLGVAVTRRRGGAESDWRGERVIIGHELVTSRSERSFSRSRTVFAGSLAAAAVIAITTALRGSGKGDGGGPVITPPVAR